MALEERAGFAEEREQVVTHGLGSARFSRAGDAVGVANFLPENFGESPKSARESRALPSRRISTDHASINNIVMSAGGVARAGCFADALVYRRDYFDFNTRAFGQGGDGDSRACWRRRGEIGGV